MSAVNVVKKNFFRDSLQLMHISEDAKKIDGIDDAVIAMGTETNKQILRRLGLATKEGEAATTDDMILAVKPSKGSSLASILDKVEALLSKGGTPGISSREYKRFFSIEAALENTPDLNFAIVSVPGQHAYEASMSLLRRGVHVQLFSDHVPVAEEVKLKSYASRNGLLLLGPSAGTSIVNGKAIAFANVVKKGNVGIVAAAGTGLQEVSVLLDRVGLGISQGLGVGGTDVSREVGGLMTLDCLRALESDGKTSLIVLVAKTPVESVMKRIIRFIEREVRKPVVACFLGPSRYSTRSRGIRFAETMHASVAEVAAIRGKGESALGRISMTPGELEEIADEVGRHLGPRQKHVRALYTGGTLVHETLLVYQKLVGSVHSNSPLSPKYSLKNPEKSRGTTILDLGDERFTSGRAHPMIDPTIRRLRLIEEAGDPTVAVIALDFILGYGSHGDPAGALLGSIREAQDLAKKAGRHLTIMAHVCGTKADPQRLEEQEAKLRAAGVILFPSNLLMAVAAILATSGREVRRRVREHWVELVGR